MSTGTIPILTCDQEDGCDEWTVDYYTVGASVPKLPEGWTAIDDYYVLCPRCSTGGQR